MMRAALVLTLLVVWVGTVHAQRGRPANDAPAVSGSVQATFSSADVRIIREHYAQRYRGLPPGLQKKYARTGQLPPGWQRKLEAFPVAIERRLPALPADYRRGVIDGHAVIVNGRTNVILDVAVLF